ncbi:MAG: DUF5791 family protein [Halanaeroarchaeum sp.]
MLLDPIEDADERTAADLHRDYLDDLRDVVAEMGVDEAVERTGLPASTLESLVEGEDPSITLEDACAILGATDEWADADTVQLEVRDSLMLRMSSAVLDVDALERELDLDLDAKTIQQKIEGRRSMSLAEYAAVSLVIERENDFA